MNSKQKMDAMHKKYGIRWEKKCKDCCNLVRHTFNKTYRKCIFYGESRSEATDWRASNVACGMWGIEFNELKNSPLYRTVNNAEDEAIKGQINLFEEE